MNEVAMNVLVRKSIVINAPLAHVFAVLTERHDAWWPRAHHIGPSEKFTAMLEPRVGGRWFERSDDGNECNWGRVLAWDPPNRLVLSWEISAEWEPDPSIASEVEIKFIAEDRERTRVELEHRNLEVYGEKAEMMRALFDSARAWMGTLRAMAEFAADSYGRQNA